MPYLPMSVPFSVECWQANYLYVSIYGAMLAQLFQTFLPPGKVIFLKNREEFWKNLVRRVYKHFYCNYLTFCSFISDGKVEFCLESLRLMCHALFLSHSS